jgi:hypothetical protein
MDALQRCQRRAMDFTVSRMISPSAKGLRVDFKGVKRKSVNGRTDVRTYQSFPRIIDRDIYIYSLPMRVIALSKSSFTFSTSFMYVKKFVGCVASAPDGGSP